MKNLQKNNLCNFSERISFQGNEKSAINSLVYFCPPEKQRIILPLSLSLTYTHSRYECTFGWNISLHSQRSFHKFNFYTFLSCAMQLFFTPFFTHNLPPWNALTGWCLSHVMMLFSLLSPNAELEESNHDHQSVGRTSKSIYNLLSLSLYSITSSTLCILTCSVQTYSYTHRCSLNERLVSLENAPSHCECSRLEAVLRNEDTATTHTHTKNSKICIEMLHVDWWTRKTTISLT